MGQNKNNVQIFSKNSLSRQWTSKQTFQPKKCTFFRRVLLALKDVDVQNKDKILDYI